MYPYPRFFSIALQDMLSVHFDIFGECEGSKLCTKIVPAVVPADVLLGFCSHLAL